MPRIKANKNIYLVKDTVEDLRWECKRYGLSQKEQAMLLNCTEQNIGKHYRNASFSIGQFLIIKNRLEELKAQQENQAGKAEQ